jgi:hypothetical protein
MEGIPSRERLKKSLSPRGKVKADTNTRGGREMEKLIREIREIIKENRDHLRGCCFLKEEGL